MDVLAYDYPSMAFSGHEEAPQPPRGEIVRLILPSEGGTQGSR